MSMLSRPARLLASALLLIVVILSVSGCNIVIGGQATDSSSTSTPTSASGTKGGGTPPGSHPTAAPPTAIPAPPKLNREVVRTTTVAAASPGTTTGFAAHIKCPAGKVSVGGGYYPDPGITVGASYPVADVNDPTSSWEVYGGNGTSSTHSVFAYAVCIKG